VSEIHPNGDYSVSLQDRLKDHCVDDLVLGPDEVFRYEWSRGAERVYHHTIGKGSSDYSGIYHPDVVCEPEPGAGVFDETGLCYWCGSVMPVSEISEYQMTATEYGLLLSATGRVCDHPPRFRSALLWRMSETHPSEWECVVCRTTHREPIEDEGTVYREEDIYRDRGSDEDYRAAWREHQEAHR
jgi:hypothetical protein